LGGDMGKNEEVYKEMKQNLNNLKNNILKDCQEQLRILEPEFKKLDFDKAFTQSEFKVFIQYNYFKSQEERLLLSDEEFENKEQKRCKDIFVLSVRYHAKYHKIIGFDNPEYREKYNKNKKNYEEFLLANNDDGKLLEYLAINEHDIEVFAADIVEITIEETIKCMDKDKGKFNKKILNDFKECISNNNQLLINQFEILKKDSKASNSQLENISNSIKELNTLANNTPKKVQQEIESTLAFLLKESCVKKVGDQYWQAKSVNEIIKTLCAAIKLKFITVPTKEEDIPLFIKINIKDKKGKNISGAVYTAMSNRKKNLKSP